MDMKDPATIELHNKLFQGASDLLLPYLEFGEGKDASSPEAQKGAPCM